MAKKVGTVRWVARATVVRKNPSKSRWWETQAKFRGKWYNPGGTYRTKAGMSRVAKRFARDGYDVVISHDGGSKGDRQYQMWYRPA